MKNIANIINFARGTEPRVEDDSFLLPTLKEELELCRAYGLPSTVLLQYDALVDPAYPALLRGYDNVELGLWLEVVGPQARDAGLPWRGRWAWDWDVTCTFLTGYTPEEREKLIDTAFERFFKIFGFYPAVAGCWTIDAHSLAYLREKYGVAAYCTCKEQFGTDGITLWGGVPFGAYYPSKTNALLPAGTAENQIPLPVFRMLGADPVYQYDLGLGSPEERQQVVSLEPAYIFGGGNEQWVDRYLNQTYAGTALAFAYAQFGQENSFGWETIKNGLPMQLKKLKELRDRGAITVQTLGESGRWFSENYALTPQNTCAVTTDSRNEGRQTLWYNSRFYRVNLFYENGRAWVRDLQLYTDSYAEPHLTEKNTAPNCGHFALPVTDGFRFSACGVRAGIYPAAEETLPAAPFAMKNCVSGADAQWGGVSFTMEETAFTVKCAAKGFRLLLRHASLPAVPYLRAEGDTLYMRFADFTGRAFSYAVRLARGSFIHTPQGPAALPDATGTVTFDCVVKI